MATTPPSDAAASNGDSSRSRRSRLEARRQQRTRKVAIAALAVGIVVALAAGGFALYNTQSTPNAAAAGPTASSTSPAAAVTDLPAVKAEQLRKLSHDKPLKVWIGGDSLAGAFGFSLGDSLGATGVAQTLVDYKVSSGLWSNDIRNWYARSQEQMLKNDPELVVFMIGTNDATQVSKVDANNDGVEDWVPEYKAKVDREMETLIGGDKHRQVIWLGAPTLGDTTLDAGAVKIDKVLQDEAKKYAPDVVYIDTYKLFEGPDGKYSRHILDQNGNDISARIGDGVHFTPDGAKYLADIVFKLIDGRWHLKAQADTAQPIGWAYAEGNGELVPGYSSKPKSKYRSSYSGNGNGSSNYNGSFNGNGNGSGNGSSGNTYTGGGSTNTTVYVAPPPSTPDTDPPPPVTQHSTPPTHPSPPTSVG